MDKVIPNFVIEYKKSLVASGVGDVISFNEREIRLNLAEGGKVLICGEGLKIVKFEKKTGEFKLIGAVGSVKFLSGGQTALKRFFK
mgnify:CR=1 FL=1